MPGPVHQGGFCEFKYDITPLLKYGSDNLLEVKVSKVPSDSFIYRAERQTDFWVMGGVFRPVYLEIKPKTYIDRIAIDAQANGSFSVDVFTSNLKKKQQLEAQIQTLKGRNVGEPFAVTASDALQKHTLTYKLANPKLWNPEFPNLYQVKVILKDGGKPVHTLIERFGFRTVELRPKDGIYVNGRRVIFKGVNRHSFWPESGRTLSREIHLMDIGLIKDMNMNMNAVRMPHYPPDKEFLNLCDSLGLFVIDELTGWQKKYDTALGRKLVKELVVRDVNHPSIILWANGNEGGWNTDLDGDYALYDPQNRPVIHPWERYNYTDTKHYPSYNYVVNSVLYGQDIFFPTEFMHGLEDGGLGAGLEDFWNLMERHPYSAGGFLWALLDEGLVRDDQGGKVDVKDNNAPDGILGPHRVKEGSFYTIKELWSPVQVNQQTIAPTFDGRLPIENKYLYTNLNQCRFSWKLVSFPGPNENTTAYKTDAEGKPAAIALAPGEKSFLQLNLPQTWTNSDALYFTAYDPYGREIYTWTWAIQPAGSEMAVSQKEDNSRAGVKVSETDKQLTIENDGITYYFDKATGYLQQVEKNGKTVSLSGGPAVAGLEHTLKSLKYFEEGDTLVVQPEYEGKPYYKVRWEFVPGQPVKLAYAYNVPGEVPYMGITFNYPEEKITGMKWLGRGPYRVWKNRLKGPQFGIWEKKYNNTVTGESWDYPEFKGYHSELHWVRVENKEMPFTVYAGLPGLFLQMLKPDKPKAAGNDFTNPPFPEGSIGFLHAISPIGTKFKAPEQMGPQGYKNIMLNYSPIKGVLWFDFR